MLNIFTPLHRTTKICTFLCRQLADVHGFIENFYGKSEGRGKCHLSLLEVLLQHGDSCLQARASKQRDKVKRRTQVPKHQPSEMLSETAYRLLSHYHQLLHLNASVWLSVCAQQ